MSELLAPDTCASAATDGIATRRPRGAPALPHRTAALDARELAWRLATPQTQTVHCARGDVLLRGGTRFEGLYVIRTGSCKVVLTSPHGDEHIVSFALPGEVIGLEALASGMHDATVHALESLTCWKIVPERVHTLLRHDPAFAQTLVYACSLDAGRGLRGMLVLGTMRADQRVASFLVDLAVRYQRLGFSGSAFELRMTRAEIGSHLGLSTETVSRALSRLRSEGLATVSGRSVRLRDRPALERMLQHGS